MLSLRAAAAGCCVSILLLAWAHPARAAGCQSEIEKLCKGKTPVIQCLRENERDLSPTCTTYLRFFEKIPTCIADASRLCPTKKPTANSVTTCLRKHKADLSAECKTELGPKH